MSVPQSSERPEWEIARKALGAQTSADSSRSTTTKVPQGAPSTPQGAPSAPQDTPASTSYSSGYNYSPMGGMYSSYGQYPPPPGAAPPPPGAAPPPSGVAPPPPGVAPPGPYGMPPPFHQGPQLTTNQEPQPNHSFYGSYTSQSGSPHSGSFSSESYASGMTRSNPSMYSTPSIYSNPKSQHSTSSYGQSNYGAGRIQGGHSKGPKQPFGTAGVKFNLPSAKVKKFNALHTVVHPKGKGSSHQQRPPLQPPLPNHSGNGHALPPPPPPPPPPQDTDMPPLPDHNNSRPPEPPQHQQNHTQLNQSHPYSHFPHHSSQQPNQFQQWSPYSAKQTRFSSPKVSPQEQKNSPSTSKDVLPDSTSSPYGYGIGAASYPAPAKPAAGTDIFGDLPKPLLQYVAEAFQSVKDGKEKDQIEDRLRDIIQDAVNTNNLNRNWSVYPKPTITNMERSNKPTINSTLYQLASDPMDRTRGPLKGQHPSFKGPKKVVKSRFDQREHQEGRSGRRGRSPYRRRSYSSSSSYSSRSPSPRRRRDSRSSSRGRRRPSRRSRSSSLGRRRSPSYSPRRRYRSKRSRSSSSSSSSVKSPVSKLKSRIGKRLNASKQARNKQPLRGRLGKINKKKGPALTGPIAKDSRAMQERAARFGSQLEKRSHKLVLNINNFNNENAMEGWEDGDYNIVGTCTDLEKDYLRLTCAPLPCVVRPESGLVRSLAHVQQIWAAEENYRWACIQLKSIRQDLTVQCIRNDFAVQVYETHARIALQVRDHEEFNQCQTQLKLLYSEGAQGSHLEFTAYRILYYMFTKNSMDMMTALSQLSSEHKQDECVAHSLKVRSAWSLNNFNQLFKLYSTAPKMSSYLMDWFLERERKNTVKVFCKAYRPTLPIDFVRKQLKFSDEGEELFTLIEDCGVVLTADKTKIDCKLSSAKLA